MRINHNTLAIIAPVVVAVGLFFLISAVPEIGFAPQETTGKISLKIALFMAAWPLALRFLGGWKYSVTGNAQSEKPHYGMIAIACAVIIGLSLVVAAK